MKALKRFLFLTFLLAALPAEAQPLSATAKQENTTFTLVTELDAVAPGKPIEAGIIIEARDGWHTYWENPGDAGIPTRLTWTLPNGFSASDIHWPAPTLLREGELATYAYPGKVFLPVTINTPAALDATIPHQISAKVDVLVCKDICVPESGTVTVNLPVSSSPSQTSYANLFEQQRNHSIQKLEITGHYNLDDKYITLLAPLEAISDHSITSANFFIRENNLINYAAQQKLDLTKDTLSLALERAGEKPENTISGVLSLTQSDNSTAAYDITFTPSAAPAVTSNAAMPDIWFPSIILLAIMGGLVLNLMPCVLPILSLKALAIAQKSASRHAHVVQHGIAYTAGIMLSFAGIAGMLLSLRAGGASIGWGFQMQSPAFVCFLIYLLFLVGLNLTGVFELPVLLGNVGGHNHDKSTIRGSFFTGVLATAVATPCTAPFMASAVGAALTMPAVQALLVFEALGFGLALPFLLISIFPRLRAFLPKPGAWMNLFKQMLAYPMYGSVIWLMWVLILQTGAGGAVVALSGMLAIVFVIWLKSWIQGAGYALIAIVLYVTIFGMSLPMLSTMEIATSAMPGGHEMTDIETVPYSKSKLDELRAAGKPVLVDATAAWCITCQVNARVAIHTPRVMEQFKSHNITLMIADWTRPSNEITDYLRSFGFSGVPLVVYYPSSEDPIVLPQILTEDIVLNTIQ